MEREIRITGKGGMSFAPDMQRVSFSYIEIKDTYEEAMKLFKEKNIEIGKKFEDIGFKNKELKLEDFSIKKEYEEYDEKKDGKTYYYKKLIGYKLSLYYFVVSKNDAILLGKILKGINCLGSKDKENEYSSIKISYYLSDIEKYKNQVLKIALNDCKEKAEVLADGSGVSLGDIKLVDYSWNNMRVNYGSERYDMCYDEDCEYNCAYESGIDINPKDIDVDAEVNMVFVIKE